MAKETREISLDGVVEHLPCHLLRRPNGIKSVTEDPASCDLCIAKAAALNRIKAAGGDIVEAAAKAKEEVKTKPAGILRAANLKEMKAKGGYIVKTEAKENNEGKPVLVATVRLPDASVKSNLMNVHPRTALLPKITPRRRRTRTTPSTSREATCASAALALSSIELEEDIVAQYFEKGYVTLLLELEEGLGMGGDL